MDASETARFGAAIADYHGVVVKKPWGYEYLVYENGHVGLWLLHIRSAASTSLHCHPTKKTGLILLEGTATVNFLNDSLDMRPLGKLMIRAGLFHQTRATSPLGADLIEIENPVDKGNLVRLDDEYERREMPYEGQEAIAPMDDTCLQLLDPTEGPPAIYRANGCVLCVEHVPDAAALRGRPPGDVVVVLKEGLFARSGEPILGPGDVVSPGTLDRLADVFSAPLGMSILSVRKET